MNTFFQFEADFVDSLRCIPMQVRLKLDTCGVKMKLSHWHQFTDSERQELVERSCTTVEEVKAYKDFLHSLILQHSGTTASELPVSDRPDWLDTTIPTSVQEKAAEFEISLTSEQWKNLTSLQRFALIKLSRSSHENKNFLPALKEFKLI